MAITPPGYCSGVVVTFLEPHLEHFMRLPTDGTGVSPGSGRLRGSMSRSRPQSQHYTQSSLAAWARSLSVTALDDEELSTPLLS